LPNSGVTIGNWNHKRKRRRGGKKVGPERVVIVKETGGWVVLGIGQRKYKITA